MDSATEPLYVSLPFVFNHASEEVLRKTAKAYVAESTIDGSYFRLLPIEIVS